MPDVLLVTAALLPDGEPGAPVLDAVLRERGEDFAWVLWNDPDVDWEAARVVASRSPWDYAEHLPEFLAWAHRLGPRLLNGADVFGWNHDKAYLADLHVSGDLPVVPTRAAAGRDDFAAALDAFGVMVVKPAVGYGGAGLIVVDDLDDRRLGKPVRSIPDYPELPGPWICQPVVESVRTEGETSVFVLDGEVSAQFQKVTSGEDLRVNEQFGGSVRRVAVQPEAEAAARAAYDWCTARFGRPLDYARVDLVRLDGRLVIGELELIEPGLYLDVSDANAGPFADLLARRLRRDG